MRSLVTKRIQKEESSQHESKKIQRKEWSKEEDRRLRQAIQKNGTNWKIISEIMVDRNPSQCAQRWKRIKPDSQRNRKGWTTEEDKQLLDLIVQYDKNWAAIAKVMSWRTGKQIRERFINQLSPDIKQGEWTNEEDRKILYLFNQHGSKWTEISKQMDGRPENSIKNRFYSHIRQAYMNIENPYYQLPSALEPKQKMKEEQKSALTKIEDVKREESQIYNHISLDSFGIPQDFKATIDDPNLLNTKANKELFAQLSFYQGIYQDQEIGEPQIQCYNSFNSDKKFPLNANSMSLQFASNVGCAQIQSFQQFFRNSLGLSEENQSVGHLGEQFQSIPFDFQQLINKPFTLMNQNVISIPVLMRSDINPPPGLIHNDNRR